MLANWQCIEGEVPVYCPRELCKDTCGQVLALSMYYQQCITSQSKWGISDSVYQVIICTDEVVKLVIIVHTVFDLIGARGTYVNLFSTTSVKRSSSGR